MSNEEPPKQTETPDKAVVYAKIQAFIDKSPEMVVGADVSTFLTSALMQVVRIEAFVLLQLQQGLLSQEAYDALDKKLTASRRYLSVLKHNKTNLPLNEGLKQRAFMAFEIVKIKDESA